jgi:hypothetical protein
MLNDSDLNTIKEYIDKNAIDALQSKLNDYDADDLSAGHIFSDQTIFMYACEHGAPEAVKAFIERGVYGYEIKYGDSTELKCAAKNTINTYEVLSLVIEMLGKEQTKEQLESNGDPYFELEGEGDGKTPIDILNEKNDEKSLGLVNTYLE